MTAKKVHRMRCDTRHSEKSTTRILIRIPNPADFSVATFGVTTIFEWDDAKRRANVRKHGFHFSEAEEMFRGLLLARPDLREDYHEERWIGIGMSRAQVALLAFAQLASGNLRIISLRKANREEQEGYEKFIQDGLEAH